MNRRSSASLVFVLALVFSLGLKYIFEVDYYKEEVSAIRGLEITDYFHLTGFEFRRVSGTGDYVGRHGDCLIRVGASNRDGDSDSAFEQAYRSESVDIVYLYKGAIYDRAPYFRAQLDHYLEMLKVAFGLKPRVNLVLHVARLKACKESNFKAFLLRR